MTISMIFRSDFVETERRGMYEREQHNYEVFLSYYMYDTMRAPVTAAEAEALDQIAIAHRDWEVEQRRAKRKARGGK